MTPFESLQAKLEAARAHAMNGGLPIRRRDRVLYTALAECLSVCEFAQSEGLEAELRKSIEVEPTGPRGRGSRRVRKTSDVYTIVCRYAFGTSNDYSSLTKYAHSLREASRRQIRSGVFADWLLENGGVQALRLSPLAVGWKEDRETQTLHLSSRVSYPVDSEFTITLRYDGRGLFDVMSPKAGELKRGRGRG